LKKLAIARASLILASEWPLGIQVNKGAIWILSLAN
ncbi:MAG: hypothetical protein ACJA0T_000782, partial [Colwellia sp.]